MCGIVGYWVRSGDDRVVEDHLASAIDAVQHRGPDADGVWRNGLGVGLGHRRLSIIDLTETGSQPMRAEGADITIVYNGEIYNFAEIARDLSARGHVLVGHSDTEVILAAYREWGSSCVSRFIGMFAFAIWDGRRRRLSLCRDRVGVKPLYYTWDGRILAFASELKALRSLPHWEPEVDSSAVGEFLQYSYISGERSIYRQVSRLLPGCWLHLDAEGEPTIERYWSLRKVVEQGWLSGSHRTLEEELEALLTDAFRYRLVADVPVGLFLSGGVDSSLVAALLKSSGATLDTYTIGFKSDRLDESAAAARVAEALGFANHATVIDATEAESILSLWPDLYDEPFGDTSGIPMYLVARMARSHVTVALSADGGDELFCGYSGYVASAHRMMMQARLPAIFRGVGAGGLALITATGPLNSIGGFGGELNRSLGHGRMLDHVQKLKGFLGANKGLDALRPFKSFWQPSEISRLLGGKYVDPRLGSRSWPGEALEQIAALDFNEYLPDDVLVKTDRATMAVGLEAREPFLDHRIVEMAFRLPLDMRIGPLGNKHVLRSILYRHVHRDLVDRPKQGFSVPIDDWLMRLIRSGAVEDSCEVLKEKLSFDRQTLDRALGCFAGSAQGRNRLWLLFVLGQWSQRWL